jgi:hypothetical protein
MHGRSPATLGVIRSEAELQSLEAASLNPRMLRRIGSRSVSDSADIDVHGAGTRAVLNDTISSNGSATSPIRHPTDYST